MPWDGEPIIGTCSGRGPSRASLRAVLASETRRIDVAALQQTNVLPKEANWTSVTLTTNGLPDEVVAVAASFDDTLRFGAQTPFNDQLSFQWEGGMWEYDPHHNSLITAGNGGTKPTQAAFTLFYNQGAEKYELEQTLQPDEQMWIDVGKLIREHVPDKNGKILPADLSSGSFEVRDLTELGIGTLFEGKLIYDKTYGHVTYGCSICCGYQTPTILTYNPLGVPLLGTSQNGVWAYDPCLDVNIDVSSYFYYNWSTANTAIATVSNAVHHGVGVGSTGSSTWGNLNSSTYRTCPIKLFPGSGNDNVTPVITSINPNLLNAGDNKKSLTINGAGFGSSPTVNLPSGVSRDSTNQQTSSNTQIQLSAVNVAATTAIGPNNITVTAGGQTSAPSPFTIDGPDHAIVVSDVLGHCSGCTTAYKRTVTLQVIKFSGSPVFVIPIGEVATSSGWNCSQTYPGVITTPCTEGLDTNTNGEFTDSWSIASDSYSPSGCGFNFTTHWQWCSAPKTFATLTGYTHTNAISMNGVVNPPNQFPQGQPIYP